jgi:type II restriction enzyme
VQANLVDYNPDRPDLPTNSPRAHYALTDNAIATIRTFGKPGWKRVCKLFVTTHGSLLDKYRKKAVRRLVPVRLPNGRILKLSPGEHNVVQAAVVEHFIPRFAPGSRLLYLGDTAKKALHVDEKGLRELGITLSEHDKIPDVVFYDPIKKRLLLVEAVTSHGPMSPKRYMELAKIFSECRAKLIFVSAFPNFEQFRKHMLKIAWETEVWIVEEPDHIIHYDGEKFLGLP